MRFLYLTFLVGQTLLAISPTRAKVFEKGSQRQKLLFNWTRNERAAGDQKIGDMVFSYPDGKPAAKEKIIFLHDKFQRYEIEQLQTNEKGFVEVRGTKLHFEYTKEGSTKADEEDYVDNFVVAPILMEHLAKNKEKLVNGETVNVRYGVLDRRETIGFTFGKVDNEGKDLQTNLMLKMKPSSVFVAAVVDPLFFVVQKDDFRLLNITGRTLPKINVDGNWKDLDADIAYFFD